MTHAHPETGEPLERERYSPSNPCRLGASSGRGPRHDPVPQGTVSAIILATSDGNEPSAVMAYSGQPIRQSVAMGGPFVTNNQAEIERAFRDFQSGKFGDIPQQARLRFR